MQLLRFSTAFHYVSQNIEQISDRVRAAITRTTTKSVHGMYEPDVNVVSHKRKTHIKWNSNVFRYVCEAEVYSSKCITNLTSVLERIHRVSPIVSIEHTSFITCWMLPTPGTDFLTLARKYQNTMMLQYNELFSGIYDASILFDSKIDGLHLHHQSGPMEPHQLLEDYLEFGKGLKFPKSFLFLLVEINTNEKLKYDKDAIQRCLERLMKIAETHSGIFQRIWEDVL